MQRDLHAAQREAFTVVMRLQRHIAQPPTQDRHAAGTAVVLAHAAARVVAVAVGDHRARHRPPRIDVEIAGRAVQALGAQYYQVAVCRVRRHACTVPTGSCTR
jgi:hypothetical protein